MQGTQQMKCLCRFQVYALEVPSLLAGGQRLGKVGCERSGLSNSSNHIHQSLSSQCQQSKGLSQYPLHTLLSMLFLRILSPFMPSHCMWRETHSLYSHLVVGLDSPALGKVHRLQLILTCRVGRYSITLPVQLRTVVKIHGFNEFYRRTGLCR